MQPGTLYIVATPIGELQDFSPRAQAILQAVDLIAAEDTRHSRRLLNEFAINTHMISLHEHNERSITDRLLQQVADGQSLAVISDAGTPLINDPGFILVRTAHERGIQVSPVPGPCAIVTLLSAAGISAAEFIFCGFLPVKNGVRTKYLANLITENRTLIFYEAPHRILASIETMRDVFGADRIVCIGRGLTKKFETIKRSSLGELLTWLQEDANQQRGEFVIVVEGADSPKTINKNVEDVLRVLLTELPVKMAAKLSAKLTGEDRQELYKLALRLKI